MNHILIMAYAFSPFKGSEFSLGWNLVTGLSKKYKVTVLVGSSDGELGETAQLESFLKKYQNNNLNVVIVKPNKISHGLNWLNLKGANFMFYPAFKAWHWSAYKVAKKIIENTSVDIVHQLGPIGFREPGYLWRLGKPFVWGPIGGAQYIDIQLTERMSLYSKCKYRLKNVSNFLQMNYSRRVKSAVSHSKAIFFATRENYSHFNAIYGVRGQVISDQACFSDYSNFKADDDAVLSKALAKKSNVYRFVWCGSLIERKNLLFIFDALSKVSCSASWELLVVGSGPLESDLKLYSSNVNIFDKITWVGKVSRGQAVQIMKTADLHLMASLSEANTAVLYEALENKVPTISIDRDGMATELSDGRGFLVPIGSSYSVTNEKYAQMIQALIDSPQALADARDKIEKNLKGYSWEGKVGQISSLYEKVLKGG